MARERLPFDLVCISLPEETARYARAVSHFSDVGVPVRMFHGVHAKTLGIRGPLGGSGELYLSSGMTGNYLSHWALWYALSWRRRRPALILEDDAELQADFRERAIAAFAACPSDWQIQCFGSCGPRGPGFVHQVGGWFSGGPILGTHAYLVRPGHLPYMLAENRVLEAATDVQFWQRSFARRRCYTFWPALVRQLSVDGKMPSLLGFP